LSKIAENCDHNIDPRGLILQKKLIKFKPLHAFEELFGVKGGEAGSLGGVDHPGHVVHGAKQPNLKRFVKYFQTSPGVRPSLLFVQQKIVGLTPDKLSACMHQCILMPF
jgi:hypothetical protein